MELLVWCHHRRLCLYTNEARCCWRKYAKRKCGKEKKRRNAAPLNNDRKKEKEREREELDRLPTRAKKQRERREKKQSIHFITRAAQIQVHHYCGSRADIDLLRVDAYIIAQYVSACVYAPSQRNSRPAHINDLQMGKMGGKLTGSNIPRRIYKHPSAYAYIIHVPLNLLRIIGVHTLKDTICSWPEKKWQGGFGRRVCTWQTSSQGPDTEMSLNICPFTI